MDIVKIFWQCALNALFSIEERLRFRTSDTFSALKNRSLIWTLLAFSTFCIVKIVLLTVFAC